MAGKMCFGSKYNNAGSGHLKSSKAYCEGIDHRIATNGASIDDNPHESGSEAAAAWDFGWSAAQESSAGTLPKTEGMCCAPDRLKTIVP